MTYSNAAIILVILRSFSEFKELSIAAYHLLAEFVEKRFTLEYLKFHSLNHDGFQIYCAILLKYDVFLSSFVGFRGYFLEDSGSLLPKLPISLVLSLFSCSCAP